MRVYEGMFKKSSGIGEIISPETIFEASASDNALRVTLIRPTGIMSHKLNGDAFHTEVTSPHPHVIRLRSSRLLGKQRRSIGFPNIPGNSVIMDTGETGEGLWCRSGALSLHMEGQAGFRVEAEGRRLTGRSSGGFAAVYTRAGEEWISDRLDLNPGDLVYGLGERFSPFVRNGQAVSIRQEDAATESDLSYKNLPFYITNAGYGVLVNCSDIVEFEVATAEVNAVRFGAPGCDLDYFLIYGPEPALILERYCELTGFPPKVPRWSWGLWLSTSFTTSYDEETVRKHIDGMIERDIPISVFHFDCFWMKTRHWVNFQWDRKAFPDPEGMLKRIRKKGIRICLWINPYVSELSELFIEAKDSGYLLRTQDGDIYQADYWQPGYAIVDFTNPEACDWYAAHLRRLMDMGVDTFKTDFGEDIPDNAVYHDGCSGRPMRNLFTRIYNKLVYKTIEAQSGSENAMVFARSATVGSQCFPVHWGGDSRATAASMAGQLRGGLSLALGGFAYWSHDIGGFFGKASPALYKRWVAFGLLSSHSRLHGNDSYRVPWEFDEESVEILRQFTHLRLRLIPYLESLGLTASRRGTPLMRPMLLEFPEDPTCHNLDRQYMLGPSILVAPVFDPEPRGRCSYYLPKGLWTEWWTGTEVRGGRWMIEERGYSDPPVFVREGAIIPLKSHKRPIEDDSAADLEIRLYRPLEGSRFTMIVSGAEVNLTVKRKDGTLVLETDGDLSGAYATLAGVSFKLPLGKNDTLALP